MRMKWRDYAQFFTVATSKEPFPYQVKLAELDSLPVLLNVPTGAGKTAAVSLAWLWRRFCHPDHFIRNATPRRLIYCLPMRTLVEQTRDSIVSCLAAISARDERFSDVAVNVLMGGENDAEWLHYPEQVQILIGTQDMLLSAALNRGYGMSRFRWPHAFGLLHNDCVWVYDEVQLMGAGLPTTAQLEALRGTFGTFNPSQSVWMSATLDKSWLNTVDFAKKIDTLDAFQLSDSDLSCPSLQMRMTAQKTLTEVVGISAVDKDIKTLAKFVLDKHRADSLTLVVLNQAERAQQVAKLLMGGAAETEVLLIHSRFRPSDRQRVNTQLLSPVGTQGRIVVATQVVEAGVDISASVLISELAPWPSMVQRFGRCNRYGEELEANICWVDVPEKSSTPYSSEELDASRRILRGLEGKRVAPLDLPCVSTALPAAHVLRKRDLVDLFDTTADLSGHDIDISRFVREENDLDVQVFWRSWESERPPADMLHPLREELCAVQVWALKAFLTTDRICWRWDYLTSGWLRVNVRGIRPGMTLLLHSDQGGYTADIGWDKALKAPVQPVGAHTGVKPEDVASDPYTVSGEWQSLADHTDQVVRVMMHFTKKITLPVEFKGALMDGARWHDAGKAHQVFQETMRTCDVPQPSEQEMWAKAPASLKRHSQPHFRHELASAMTFLANSNLEMGLQRYLAAYLVASHHGKVRLSIRSLPGENLPKGVQPDTRIARGIWDGSMVTGANLGGEVSFPDTVMNLATMELGVTANGEPSWLEMMLRIRDEFGPFRLTYLESLLRAADIRASIGEEGGIE